ncbi:MAG: DUF3995 domain-containing protein [Reyranella sp.]|nr:DUF3995 domain-containing protein [Reyranella sp.]MDP3161707.1 DUF3995 domain-containing protein [Reyranella sp.]
MNIVLAFLLFVGVGAISVVHALWGLGSTWPEANEEALARGVVGNGRKRMPPPWQCFAVAILLGLVALWPWYVLGRSSEPAVLTGTFAIAGAFVARGWAGYSPRWRSIFYDEPFARRDKRYYSPYSLLLGVSYLALLAGEMDR